MSDLLSLWDDLIQAPACEVLLGGAPARPISWSVSNSVEDGNAVATLVFARYPSLGGLRVPVKIRAGYGPYMADVFTGDSQDSVREIAPHRYSLTATGAVKRTRYQYGGADVPFLEQTDGEIVATLLQLSGIAEFDIEERGIQLANVQPIWLRQGQAPFDLISRIGQDWGYALIDGPDGIVRYRRVNGFPASTAAFTFTEGEEGFSYVRNRTLAQLHNMAVVEGLPQGAFTPRHIQGDPDPLDPDAPPHPWVPDPPRWWPIDHKSDLLETLDHVEEVALRKMFEHNVIQERCTIRVPGNPYLLPGITVAIISASTGITAQTNYLVESVTHDWSISGGFKTTLNLKGGIGAPGEPGDPYGDGAGGGGQDPDFPDTDPPGQLPEPSVEYVLSREGFLPIGEEVADVGGIMDLEPIVSDNEVYRYEEEMSGPTHIRLYTFNARADSSYSPVEAPTGLSYAWSNNANGDTGDTVEYATAFTQAQIEAGVEVYLQVTDSAARSRTLTIPLTPESAQMRMLAAVGPAVRWDHEEVDIAPRVGWISPDGGETWYGAWIEGRPIEEAEIEVLWDPDIVQSTGNFELFGGHQVEDWTWRGVQFGDGQWLDVDRLKEAGVVGYRIVYVPTEHPPSNNNGSGFPWVWTKVSGDGGETESNHGLHFGMVWLTDEDVVSDVGGYWASSEEPFDLPESGLMRARTRYGGSCCEGCESFAHNWHNCKFGVQFAYEDVPKHAMPSVTATPEINPAEYALFGTSDGRMFKAWVEDGAVQTEVIFALGSANVDRNPLDHTHPVTAIWPNESDHDRITVATGDGSIYRTVDGGATWSSIFYGSGHLQIHIDTNPLFATPVTPGQRTFGLIRQIIESATSPGQYRIVDNNASWITTDDFQSVYAGGDLPVESGLIQSPGAARQVALSPFGNWIAYAASDLSGQVRDELTGDELTLPELDAAPTVEGYTPDDVSAQVAALTHHIRDGVLWAITGTGHVLHKAPGASVMTFLATLPGAIAFSEGTTTDHFLGPEHMVRDGSSPLTLYVAGFRGLYKSWDGGNTWRVQLDRMSEAEAEATYEDPENSRLTVDFGDRRYTFSHVSYGSLEWRL